MGLSAGSRSPSAFAQKSTSPLDCGRLLPYFSRTFAIRSTAPVDLFAGDDEGRRNANHVIVRLLAQDSLFLERFATGSGVALQLNGDPQSPCRVFLLNGRVLNGPKPGKKVSPQPSLPIAPPSSRPPARAMRPLPRRKPADCRRRCQPCSPGCIRTQYLARRKHCGNRIKPACEGLAEDQNIRRDVFVLIRE